MKNRTERQKTQLAAVCRKLKEIRLARNVTQKQMDEVLGITQNAYWRWENQKVYFKSNHIFLIITKLKIKAEELFEYCI